MYELLTKKIRNSRVIAINAFVSVFLTITVGIIFQVIISEHRDIISIVFFSYAAGAIVLTLFFDYRYRTLSKYKRILDNANHKEEDAPTLQSREIKKEDIIERNRPGSFMKNLKRYVDRHGYGPL